MLQKWLKKLPKDVSFRRVPAVFPGRDGTPGQWAPGAKLYYTLERWACGEKLHGDIFEAVQSTERTDLLSDEACLFDWIGKKGVDATPVRRHLSTPSPSRARCGAPCSSREAHGLDGVPALIVDGRYRPANGAAGSYEDTLAIVDQLIDKARKDRGGKKK